MLFGMVQKNLKKIIALALLFSAFNMLSILVIMLFAKDIFSPLAQITALIFLLVHLFVRTSVAKSVYIMYTGTTTNLRELVLCSAKVIGAYALIVLSALLLFALSLFFPLLAPIFAFLFALSFLLMVIAYYRIIAGERFIQSFIPKNIGFFLLTYLFFSELLFNGAALFLIGEPGGAANPLSIILLSFFTIFKIVMDYYMLLSS